jgi:predicted dienelactone hydrolase
LRGKKSLAIVLIDISASNLVGGVATAMRYTWIAARNFFYSLCLVLGCATPGFAAEQLILRVGPFEQRVDVADLEQFAQTGRVPNALKLYEPFLNSQVREALNARLQLDPNVGNQVVANLLKSPSGRQMLESIQRAVPGLTVEQLQLGLTLAARQANGLDVLRVIRAIPEETLTVDVTEAIGVVSQLNLSYLQTQALSPLLERELKVETQPIFSSFDPAGAGVQVVQQQTFALQDPQRRRSLPVELYWSEQPQGPLVVISPGFEANRTFLAYLARHLASHGLVVAAIEHPYVTNRAAIPTDLERLLPASEFVDRPKDISFLLDQLTEMNRQPGVLQGKFNTEQVSVIGHSLGGYTALALAGAELDLDELRQFCQNKNPLQRAPADWLQCAATRLSERRLNLRDRRIAQVMALNPVIGRLFGDRGLRQVETPVLMLAASDDTLTPVLSHQLQPFTQLRQPKWLLTAIGGTHLSVSDPATVLGATAQGTLVRERRGAEVDPLRQLLQGVSLAFVKQLTPEAEKYQPFLSSAYAQSYSSQTLALRLNDRLPSSLNFWLELTALL